MATGTVTETYEKLYPVKKVTLDWTSSAGGTISGTASSHLSGIIERVCLVPSSATAPTALYDVTILDDNSLDILQGLGLNLSASVSKQFGIGEEVWIEDSADTELYKTKSYSGSDATVSATILYTSDIMQDRDTDTVIDIKFDASGTTDNLLVYLYRRRDATWDNDEIARTSVEITSDGSEDIYSMDLDSYGPGHYRLGIASAGSTDDYGVDIEMRQYHRVTFRGIAVNSPLTLGITNAGNAKCGDVILYLR